MKDANRKPSGQSDRLPNDWLEFAILVVVGFGVGGAVFSLLYLMHEAGII
jgi:hypothetical protein